jgi:ribonuclease HI
MAIEVYADAEFHDGFGAAIGVVLCEYGEPLEWFGSRVDADDNNHAEVIAVETARRIYPNMTIFTDSEHAARLCNATWVSRKQNKHAHNIAKATWADHHVTRYARKPFRRQRNFIGRGVIRIRVNR